MVFKGLQQLKLAGDLASQMLVTYSGNSDEVSLPLKGQPSSSGCRKTCGLAKSPLSSSMLCSPYLVHVCVCFCLCSRYSSLPFSGNVEPTSKDFEKVEHKWWLVSSFPCKATIPMQPPFNFFQILLFHFSVWYLYKQPYRVAIHFIFNNTKWGKSWLFSMIWDTVSIHHSYQSSVGTANAQDLWKSDIFLLDNLFVQGH